MCCSHDMLIFLVVLARRTGERAAVQIHMAIAGLSEVASTAPRRFGRAASLYGEDSLWEGRQAGRRHPLRTVWSAVQGRCPMPASCRGGTAFPHEQALPGSRADPQIRIFTQVHEDSVKKLPVLAEAEPCAAMPGQRMTHKRIWMAGQIANDVFPHTGVFDASDLAAELEQQGMRRLEEHPQIALLQAAEGCRAERQVLPETLAHGKGVVRRHMGIAGQCFTHTHVRMFAQMAP